VLWRKPKEAKGKAAVRSFAMHASQSASITTEQGMVQGATDALPLILRENPEDDKQVVLALARFPYLHGCCVLRFETPLQDEQLAQLVQSQLCVSMTEAGQVSSVTGIQMAGVLDHEYDTLQVSWMPSYHTMHCHSPHARAILTRYASQRAVWRSCREHGHECTGESKAACLAVHVDCGAGSSSTASWATLMDK
jgi:hypothetical protein